MQARARSLRLDVPGLKERCDRLEEALEVIKLLFTEGNGGFADYDGRYYQFDHCPLSPPCYQKPHLPILVGGQRREAHAGLGVAVGPLRYAILAAAMEPSPDIADIAAST